MSPPRYSTNWRGSHRRRAAPDGLNINLGCGILNPQATAKTVVRERADIGVLLDGDADRIGVIDEKGGLHNGDAILFLIVADRLRRRLPVSGVVGTVLSNLALEEKMRSLGVAFHRSPVRRPLCAGRNGSARLSHRRRAVRACHPFRLPLHRGRRHLRPASPARHAGNRPPPVRLPERFLTPVPQTGRDIAATAPHRLLAAPAVKRAIARAHDELGRHARLVVRASGTEPKIRLMVEGKNRQRARRVIDTIEAALKSAARTAKRPRRQSPVRHLLQQLTQKAVRRGVGQTTPLRPNRTGRRQCAK